MLNRFKRSPLGRWLKGLAKYPVIGWPIRRLARLSKADYVQPERLNPTYRAHDMRQARILARFNAETAQKTAR